MNDSYHMTFQGGRLWYPTGKTRTMIIAECYKGSNESKTIYLDFCTFELQQWDRLTQKLEVS